MLLLAVGASLSASLGQSESLLDKPMMKDPPLAEPMGVQVFDDRLSGLWKWGLTQPDVETVRRTAGEVARVAEQFPEKLKPLIPSLTAALDAPGQHPLVRLAAAKALIQLDARQATALLLKHNQSDGTEMVLLTDPALAAWKDGPAQKVWIERLSDAGVPRAVRLSAISAIRLAQTPATSPLLAIALAASADPSLRLAAAQTLGATVAEGLEKEARGLWAGLAQGTNPIINRLCAANLLSSHRSEQALALLLEMAFDPEPGVAAVALRRLVDIRPELLKPRFAALASHSDPKVRHLAAEGALAWHSVEGVTAAAPMLDDLSPQVRQFVRQGLTAADQDPALREAERAAAMRVLAAESWRGLEQATLLLGKLDHKPAAPRLLMLLKSKRPEVRLAAVLVLRWLALPETLPPLLAHAQAITDRAAALREEEGRFRGADFKKLEEVMARYAKTYEPPRDGRVDLRTASPQGVAIDAEMAQIFQMFGQMNYAPAEALLRRYIPKHSFVWDESRGAAIWALGRIKEDKLDETLAKQLVGRLIDYNPTDPELEIVHRMSAITLGRMRAASGLGTMQGLAKDTSHAEVSTRMACRWAIQRITGETFPPLAPMAVPIPGGFLEPMN